MPVESKWSALGFASLLFAQAAGAQAQLCEPGRDAAELFSNGVRYQHSGLKISALSCYDLARRADPYQYRYHRAYTRQAHEVGRQTDIKAEYTTPSSDKRYEVIRLTILARLNESNPPQFVEIAKSAVALDPTNVWAADALSSAYDVIENHEEAIKVAEGARVQNRGVGENSMVLANVLRNSLQKPNQRVIDLLLEAQEDEFYRPYARAFQGFYLIEMGKEDSGVDILQKNIMDYPYLGLTHILIGRYNLHYKKDIAAAKQYFTKGISLNLVDSIFYNIASWDVLTSPLAQKEDVVWAAQLAITAVSLSGRKDPALLDTLAEAKYRLGDNKKAIEIEEEALALGPHDAHYYQAQLKKFGAKQ